MKKYIFKLDKTMKKYIFALIASVMATGAMAQTMTPQEERAINQKVYQVVSDYATYASANTKQKEERFKYLFKNGNIKVANDLMGLSYEQTLTVDEYVKLLRSVHRLKVSVKNIQKGQITDGGDVWNIPVMMDKAISFVGACGYYFDSQAFFKKDYRVQAILAVDKSSGQCQIVELKSEGERLRFPRSYRVLEKHDERDNKLTINDNMVAFNDYNQVMLRSDDVIKYLGGKIDEVTVKDDCGHKIHARYSDKAFRVRPNAGFAVSDFNKLCSPGDGLEAKKASEMSFGVDLGYVFPSKGRLQTGVFVGVGISKNSLEMEFSPTEEISTKAKDVHEDSYTRKYDMKDCKITQKMEASNIAVPLYLDLEYRVTPSVSVYTDLGLKAYLANGSNTATIGKYTTWGEKYDNYNDLVIYNVDGLGLKTFGSEGKESDIGVDETGLESKTAIDALLGLGLRYNIGKSAAIDAGVQYLTGTKSWECTKDVNKIMSYDGVDKVNLLRNSEGVKHGALKATVSLIVKF